VTVAEQENRTVLSCPAADRIGPIKCRAGKRKRRVRGGGHVRTLAMRLATPDHLGSTNHRDLGGAVLGGIVGDENLCSRKCPSERFQCSPDAVGLVAGGDQNHYGKGRGGCLPSGG